MLQTKNIQIKENDFDTYESSLEAVKENGFAIVGVPEKFIDKEMALIAVRQYGDAYKYLPEHLKMDTEIINTAFENKDYPLELNSNNLISRLLFLPSKIFIAHLFIWLLDYCFVKSILFIDFCLGADVLERVLKPILILPSRQIIVNLLTAFIVSSVGSIVGALLFRVINKKSKYS